MPIPTVEELARRTARKQELRQEEATDLSEGSPFQRRQMAEKNSDLIDGGYLEQANDMGGALLASGMASLGASGLGAIRGALPVGSSLREALGRKAADLSDIATVSGASPYAYQSGDAATAGSEGLQDLKDYSWENSTPEESLAMLGGYASDLLTPAVRSQIQSTPRQMLSAAAGRGFVKAGVPKVAAQRLGSFTASAPLSYGDAYNRLIAQGVPHERASTLALGEGAVNAGLDTVADVPMLKSLGYGVDLVNAPVANAARRIAGRLGAGAVRALSQPVRAGVAGAGQKGMSMVTDYSGTGVAPTAEQVKSGLASALATGMSSGAGQGLFYGARDLGAEQLQAAQQRRANSQLLQMGNKVLPNYDVPRGTFPPVPRGREVEAGVFADPVARPTAPMRPEEALDDGVYRPSPVPIRREDAIINLGGSQPSLPPWMR